MPWVWPVSTRLSKRVLLVLLAVLMVWLALGLGPRPLLYNRANSSYAVTDRNGQLLKLSLSSDEKYRLWTPLPEISPQLINATLHYEDRWFYYHPGINAVALGRAVWSSLITRQRWMGASTLTMQLARQRWRLKTHTLSGKLKQMAYALWLEQQFSKDELLEAYLNLAPYGANIEGAAAASWVYFHKPVNQLSAAEAKALALIPQNPSERAPSSPASKANLQAAWQHSYGDDSGFASLWFRQRQELPNVAPHFCERLHSLYPQQTLLHSSLDSNLQALSEQLMQQYLAQLQNLGINNATLMVMHTPTMAVRAYIGSADYQNRAIQGFVNGLKAPRSPGSTLKPFIYALAMAQGLITPDTRLKDTPLQFVDYQPENFERNFYGPLPASEALIRSRNIPAVSLLARLQNPNFLQFLQQAQIPIPKQAANYGLSLAIGSAEISMEDLLRLYGIFANQGQLKNLNWLNDAETTINSVVMPEAAYLVNSMLQSNPRPQRSFGGHSYQQQQPVAWKTGTSSGLRDAWAIGLSGEWLVGVWLGNFDGTANKHLVGRELAGPLLFDVLDALTLEHPASQSSLVPSHLKRIEVCPLSGQPVSAWCPHGHYGWIIPGVSPIKTCTVHRQIRVNPANGLRLCPDETGGETRVAEFWDSDELTAFKQAGVLRDSPPAFEKPCEQTEITADNGGPKIITPRSNAEYPIRHGQNNPIQLNAVSSGGQQRLFWFVDDQFVGEGHNVLWQPHHPGLFNLIVSDDQGRSASTSITVSNAD